MKELIKLPLTKISRNRHILVIFSKYTYTCFIQLEISWLCKVFLFSKYSYYSYDNEDYQLTMYCLPQTNLPASLKERSGQVPITTLISQKSWLKLRYTPPPSPMSIKEHARFSLDKRVMFHYYHSTLEAPSSKSHQKTLVSDVITPVTGMTSLNTYIMTSLNTYSSVLTRKQWI